MQTKKGKLFVVSAPSGAGKTTLCNKLLEEFEHVGYSVSYTTRKPRFDEKHGIDYYFVDVEEFERMISEDEFIEWAKVHGNYYGTSRKTINDTLATGRDILLDIDPQGARQLREKLGFGCYVFIIAPSMKALEDRLRGRRTEEEDVLQLRLENAKKEIPLYREYDYIIVNEDFDTAYNELRAVYICQHLKTVDIKSLSEIMKDEV